MKTLLSFRDISNICLELSLFIHAGAEGGSALSLLAEECDSSSLKKLLLNMSRDADNGKKLYQVFEESLAFPFDLCRMLQVGEETGNLEPTLKALSEYYDRRETSDRNIRSAFVYPSILLLVMATVVVLLLTKVLPIFNDVYNSLGTNLSGFAAILLSVGNTLSKIMPILVSIAALCISFIAVFSVSQSFRSFVLGLSNNSRGYLGKRMSTSRFANALAMALRSGLSPSLCIETAATLFPEDSFYAEKCRQCISLTKDGKSIADALRISGLLPAAECRLLALGIKGGNAELVSEEIATRLERDEYDALDKTVGRAEPLMVIISCILVGIILLSVMIPLANIMSAIG